jgi:hypothetical protein
MGGYVAFHPPTMSLSQKKEPYTAGSWRVYLVLPRHAPQQLLGDPGNSSGEDERGKLSEAVQH